MLRFDNRRSNPSLVLTLGYIGKDNVVLPNPAGLSAELAVKCPQQGGTIWVFFPNRRNEENLTSLERLQKAQRCATHFTCDCEQAGIFCLTKTILSLCLFFFLFEVILFFLDLIGKKTKTKTKRRSDEYSGLKKK